MGDAETKDNKARPARQGRRGAGHLQAGSKAVKILRAQRVNKPNPAEQMRRRLSILL